MNFIEAMKSGRRFKRKSWAWYTSGLKQGKHEPYTAKGVIVYWKGGHAVSAEELTATDWEVEPLELAITLTDLHQTLRNLTSLKDRTDPLQVWDLLLRQVEQRQAETQSMEVEI